MSYQLQKDGEGIAYTDNYFYAYYRNIGGKPIPFASVYMNEYESQDVVNEILRDGGEKRTAREWFDWFNGHTRDVKSKDDAIIGSDKKTRNPRRNGRVDSELSQYGAYYDSPELFVKSKRTYKRKVDWSLRDDVRNILDAYDLGDDYRNYGTIQDVAVLYTGLTSLLLVFHCVGSAITNNVSVLYMGLTQPLRFTAPFPWSPRI